MRTLLGRSALLLSFAIAACTLDISGPDAAAESDAAVEAGGADAHLPDAAVTRDVDGVADVHQPRDAGPAADAVHDASRHDAARHDAARHDAAVADRRAGGDTADAAIPPAPCVEMCEHIYAGCGLAFSDGQGGEISAADCPAACAVSLRAGSLDLEAVACLTESCDTATLDRCLDGEGPGGGGSITMRANLSEAQQIAAELDPGAHLVAIKGLGVDADGEVDLDDEESYMKRWEYSFYNPGAGRHLTVTWLTPAYGGERPYVDESAGNVVETEPVEGAGGLVDSDVAVRAYASAGCGRFGGADLDSVIYHTMDGAAVIDLMASEVFWRGTARAPVEEIIACD